MSEEVLNLLTTDSSRTDTTLQIEATLDVSVIIVSWNTRDILRDCLKSVYDQTHASSFEIIVVDNASRDGTTEMVRASFPHVTLISNEDNRGFAAANNQGLRIALGRYVLLLNPDTIILDRAIEKTLAFADQNPDIGVVGCQVLENETTIQRTCFSFPTVLNLMLINSGLSRLLPRSHVFGRPEIGWWNRDTQRDVDVVSGMFMLVRRKAMMQVGLMDEDYFIYAEEADWCYRFWRAGWRCVFAPVAQIIHLDGGSKSTRQVSAKMYVQCQKSILLLHRKRFGRLSWAAARGVYATAMLVRSLAWHVASFAGVGRQAKEKASQSTAAFWFHFLGVEPES